jgi:hypothetical protein
VKLLALIVGVLLLGGCTATATGAPSPSGTPSSSAPTPVADPTAISIPAIDARSTLIPLGLTPDGALATPPVDDPMLAGWYAGAQPGVDGDEYQPGENGPAVIVGHVDGVIDGRKGQPGIFARLDELAPGDDVFVDQADGGQLRFLVERVERHNKDAFPTEAVYLADDMPRLNLITCGGVFNRAAGHYEDNLIVFTTLAPDQP